jgi:hypothetical protein
MRHARLLHLLLASVFVAPSASATPTLLAIGELNGISDLSGLSGLLENGVAGDVLGGLGSGLAYAGGTTFLALPDRGPNAVNYNAAVDNTTSYISRFQTLNISLTANGPGAPLPYTLTPSLVRTTLLSSPTPLTYGTGAGLGTQFNGTPLGSGAPALNTAGTNYFTGRSDNFGTGNSGNAANGRLDPEGIRASVDGKSVFVSDEYGPYVRQFDRATGSLIKTFDLPANLNVSNLSPVGNTEISGNTSGRTANKGMEGLALTPDGKTLVGVMQAALIQDNVNPTKNLVRIVTIDIATGATKEFGYKLTTGSGVSEIVAINDHEFLIDERDGKGLGDGSVAVAKQLFKIDLTGATDITGLSGAAALGAAVNKTLFLDLVSALTAAGITADKIPSKIEGMAFGQDLIAGGVVTHTLLISNDNDFTPDLAGPNTIYAFGFTDADLNYVPEAFASETPLPASFVLFGTGLLGVAGARCRFGRRVSAQQAAQ